MFEAVSMAERIKCFKQVTPAQAELLIKLFEENSEVIQVIAKVMLYGFDEVNVIEPDGPSNVQRLEKELGDVTCIMNLLDAANVIDLQRVREHAQQKRQIIGRWLVHNHVDENGDLYVSSESKVNEKS